MKISRQRERTLLAEVAEWPDWLQDRFRQLRRKNSLPMAHMLACRESPRLLTDDVVMSGFTRIKDMPDSERIIQQIRENGGEGNPNNIYLPEHASKLGDPDAEYGHGDCLTKMRKTLAAKGVDSEGIISVKGSRHKPREVHQPEYTRLHPRIVDRIQSQKIQENPDLAHVDQRELREAIADEHGSPV